MGMVIPGGACGAGVACAPPCSIGMAMPGAMVESEAGAGVWPACGTEDLGFAVDAFLVAGFLVGFSAAAFFDGGFFFATGLAGIGIVMPGICSCCADAGAATTT